MTTDELDALPVGTTLYLPTDWEVVAWTFAGRVANRNWYTLLYPPDQDGTINNRRPQYIDAVHLMTAQLDERTAWREVVAGLDERKVWIHKHKLK
jgi:hypothetical protein